MPQYQVDSEQIQSSSAAVQASVSQIRQAVAGMYSNLNTLQGVWRGIGGDAIQRGRGAMAYRATADGGIARIDPTSADAGLHGVCRGGNRRLAPVRAVITATTATYGRNAAGLVTNSAAEIPIAVTGVTKNVTPVTVIVTNPAVIATAGKRWRALASEAPPGPTR